MKTQIDDELVYILKTKLHDINENILDMSTALCNSMAVTDDKLEQHLVELDKSIMSVGVKLVQNIENMIENQVAIGNLTESISTKIHDLSEIVDLGFDRLNSNIEKLISVLEKK